MTDDVIPLGPGAGPDGDDPRAEDVPSHVQDDERTLGGGVMATGGTSIERGTDTIAGPPAQGADATETGDADADEGILPEAPTHPEPYVPAVTGEAVDEDRSPA